MSVTLKDVLHSLGEDHNYFDGKVPVNLWRGLHTKKGGGLFAANYSLRGSLSDPSVSVKPLSALTPGFLRGLFGNF